jgi:hypothetical protein
MQPVNGVTDGPLRRLRVCRQLAQPVDLGASVYGPRVVERLATADRAELVWMCMLML